MSLITRCPACTTLFKVVQDQLRISDGWVRCGQCDEVFDANAHLQSLDAAQDPSVRLDEVVPDADSIPQDPLTPVVDQDVAQAETADHAGEEPSLTESLDAPGADGLPASHQDVIERDIGEALAREPNAPLGLSFMKKSHKQSTRYGALWVVFGGFSIFLLAVLLCLQVMLQERDRLAVVQPSLSPLLVSLCEVLDCKLAPLRQIESVVIESSSFVNVRGSVYRLNVTLKNTAPFAVAAPALELTLTDLQDQAVIRRVIAANELGPTPKALATGAEFQTILPMSVKLPTAADKFSGYRLAIFYP